MLLTDCLADPQAGGAERRIYDLAERLHGRGFEVVLASLDCEGTDRGAAAGYRRVPVRIFPVRRIYGLSGWREGIRFLGTLRRMGIEVLMTYHFGSDVWGTFWARLAGVRRIVSNRRDMGFWRGPWHTRTYRLIDRWVDGVVTVSEAVAEMVRCTEGVPDGKIRVIPNGTALPPSPGDGAAVRREWGVSPETCVLIHVANLKPVKGHRYLLEALRALRGTGRLVLLVSIGEDDMDGALQEEARRLGVADAVRWLGKRDDVPRLLAGADIGVMPSLSEGMSNAVLEYMAAGRPVVATRVGGNPETVAEGETGLLVPPEDATALADALRILIDDPNLRRRMGAAGRRRVQERFSVERMVAAYRRFLSPEADPGGGGGTG